MYKYKADIITSGGTLYVEAVSFSDGEVMAVFKDDLGTWRKTYIDVKSFQEFISSLHVKNRVRVMEVF